MPHLRRHQEPVLTTWLPSGVGSVFMEARNCRGLAATGSSFLDACGIIQGIHQYTVVLVSARTELVFFLVAGIMLCFGFSRKIMLITR